LKRRGPATFRELTGLMHTLRAPGGCPWDAAQTHKTLLKYLREESEEVARAVRKGDHDNLKEELGDVLLQVLFHAELAAEAGRFTITDVMTVLRDKLLRRHPHVFSPIKERLTPAEVHRRWKKIKAAEKAAKRA
jgi:MazG family protein